MLKFIISTHRVHLLAVNRKWPWAWKSHFKSSFIVHFQWY